VERVGALFQEAEDLGVCVVVLAGGEPLLRPDILQLAEGHPRVIFPLCTNGLLLSDPWIQRLRTRRHLIPVLCLNNLDPEMDIRGRVSSHRLTLERARALRAAGVFFGVSLTVTSRNAHALTDAAFVDELTAQGCRLFCYTEHIPLTPSDAELALSPGQRRLLAERIRLHRRRRKALFVSFPGDGDVYGGCLDAGRGFIHVSASGHVEPCPVASYSDQNLADTTLRSALTSQALRSLRSRAGHLGLQDGGAALFSRHEWVRPVLVREERV
jgi:MoaA/NifB/PqqE/SkfB family radical SAM enzyme